MKIFPCLFIYLMLTSLVTTGQKLPAGPQVVTFFSDADDTEQPYGLYVPKNYDESKKYPLVIMLHGAGSNHRLALRRVFGKSNANGETDVEATRYFPEWNDVDYIVASPYARGTMGYQTIAEKDVYDVLADVRKRFSIDENRIYLTGLSMGGGGTLWIGLTRPDIWAAMAPVCPAPPTGTELLAPNALNIPMQFFHGDIDQAVPVSVSRDWVKRLKDLGTNVTYQEYPGVNHDSWVNAYKDEYIFTWFSQFKRNPFPDRVRFNTTNYKYNQAYWVRVDQLTPGTLASIDVKFTAPNQLKITTAALEAFTLQLKGHPLFKADQPITYVINGGKKIKTQVTESLSLMQEKGKWIVGKYEASAISKKEKAEGPISEAFSSRHVYVYGTGGNPDQAELTKRRELAEEAAGWSLYRGAFLGRVMFFPRVLSDKEVRPSDLETCNLILFGTKETNTLIEKYSDRLPVQLQASAAADHGLFMVFPVDGHYVAVSSGLPWWAGQQTQGFRFMPAPAVRLMDFKDFVLFKGAVGSVIAEGYFNSAWQLTEGDKTKIKSSGVAAVK
ncbi:MAG TPA: alpha/beta hydrolase-fold protein [Ohtaekwangia sp.]